MPWEVNMLERLVETFCAVDDFCKAFLPQWEAYLIRNGTAPRGPEPGLSISEIITILLMLHGARFNYLKSFYNGVTGEVLRRYLPGMQCYERFVTLQPRELVWLLCFLLSRLGQEPAFITSTRPHLRRVTTAASAGTKPSRVWRRAARPAWAGSSASSSIWCAITSMKSWRSSSPPAMSMTARRWSN